MNWSYVGLDVGGTGAKAGVYDRAGRLLGSSAVGYTHTGGGSNCFEIDADLIYDAARESVARAVSESKAAVRAMAISSQGQTFVSLDERLRPLHRAIVWYDSRAVEEAAALREAVSAVLGDKSGLVIEPISSAPKVIWLRKHFPDVMRRARYFALLPDYFALRLTGRFVTDPATAGSTGLYDEGYCEYPSEALAAAEIRADQFAAVLESGVPIGRLGSETAREWNLSDDVLLVTGTNDQYAGALGAGNCRPGMASETTGTCLALVSLAQSLPEPLPSGLFGGRFPMTPYRYGLAYSKTAGVVIDWFRREMCPEASLRELDDRASRVAAGSDGLIVLPHFDGTVSPRGDQNARGYICELRLDHTSAHVYRAILESIAFSLRENAELLQGSGFAIETIRSLGGGAKSDLWLQIKADVTGCPMQRPVVTEAATLGAAMIAAVGAGDFSSIEDAVQSLYKIDRVFEPDREAHMVYEDRYRAYRELCARAYCWS